MSLPLVGTAVALVFLMRLGLAPDAAAVAVLILALVSLFWVLRSHIHAILFVALSAMLMSTIASNPWPKLWPDELASESPDELVQAWHDRGPFNDSLPVVLHLIFDELISPGALGGLGAEAAGVRQAFYDLGNRHGFRTFDSVYSRFFFSGVSLPNLMNAEYEGRGAVADQETGIQEHTGTNAYFDAMAAQGYRTIVFQTAVLDFCGVPSVRMCETFDSFDPAGGTNAQLDVHTRTLGLWSTLLRSLEPSFVSEYGQQWLRHAYGLDTRELGVLGAVDRYDVQQFPRWFDRFTRFAARAPRGSHVFAHFMVPHAPYLLTSECVVSGTFEAGYYLVDRFEAGPRRENARQRFYEDYLNQVRCVQQKLDEFLVALTDVESLSDATIVIHGDHGSRISAGNRLDDYTARDFVDNYGTYFAVRTPAVTPGIDCRFLSLPQVFRRSLGAAAPAESGIAPDPVFVQTRAGGDARVTAEMPVFGCAERSSLGG